MSTRLFTNALVILPDQMLPGAVEVEGDRILAVHDEPPARPGAEVIDLDGDYLAPGFIDLHVHGGAGADFMDGTADAFRTVCRAHARHGTTSLLPPPPSPATISTWPSCASAGR
jgi:N-acetylglucosamine-6-phosphate deacetylase